MTHLALTRSQVEQMMAHARAEAPLEACGLLGGKNGCALRVYPTVNALRSPNRYLVQPEQLLEALEALEAEGWGPDPLAIYHSHPHGPETPSATDIAESYYPNSVHIIIAYPNRPRPSLRGFRIVNGEVSEVELQVEGGRNAQPSVGGGV